ncbi:hypothetical protein Afil01_33600 [Actinorhabdospora filicis]|uniref:Uncharacterized protein n=1 Tax=Actinorhabdospora filicis TaxID=1785913 RepID=A0A9W6SM74_9ACTN|nr:hypothetical protein [Actinorhabdospora filicis]GLZ78553.1 hypothetical protein Afil01_33600 [Actinorhabdospora filicis]
MGLVAATIVPAEAYYAHAYGNGGLIAYATTADGILRAAKNTLLALACALLAARLALRGLRSSSPTNGQQ